MQILKIMSTNIETIKTIFCIIVHDTCSLVCAPKVTIETKITFFNWLWSDITRCPSILATHNITDKTYWTHSIMDWFCVCWSGHLMVGRTLTD